MLSIQGAASISRYKMATNLPEYVLRFLSENHPHLIGHGYAVEEVKSAQQQVWILTLTLPFPDEWSDAVNSGGNRLVVRQWKGSARWWNLNNNDDSPERLARAEVAAYRISHDALPHLVMPQVLHFSSSPTIHESPWAIFSYVGEHSVHFDDTRKPTTERVEGMIQVRREFGFDEPHPRWGRVPVEQAEEYALEVLRTVTIPLHQHLANNPNQDWHDLSIDGRAITYADMVAVFREAYSRMVETIRSNGDGSHEKWQRVTDTLAKCIAKLNVEASTIKPLAGVLVHMDCQPQNLIFRRCTGQASISSVLDWEEAAYADARFELLLMGRKVCANRKQANKIWESYENGCQLLGDIEPWLRLEAIHSITTLTLQSLNLLGGGRNPWESNPDLWEKITRDFHRLIALGWEFCSDVVI
jgi:Phosphotransferase enzyme family